MPSPRAIAVALPVRDGHVLVLDGVDRTKGQPFHRAIGGGIEPGETPEQALRRELVEELDVTIEEAVPLGVVDNWFVYEGEPGHEVVHVFGVRSTAIDAIPLDARLTVLDEGSPVGWRPLDGLDRPLYPTGCEALARQWASRVS
ncbi:NUDIX domain-containing protein [Agrococcus jejuensis]|uniref:NUDIX domain-containing protein n=1 Tax=Agrococcus jejuensis TaxID=399736 RepID=UPI0011A999E7|nr:NUDIX domain-containing protein [Agrococcus jejuensis]